MMAGIRYSCVIRRVGGRRWLDCYGVRRSSRNAMLRASWLCWAAQRSIFEEVELEGSVALGCAVCDRLTTCGKFFARLSSNSRNRICSGQESHERAFSLNTLRKPTLKDTKFSVFGSLPLGTNLITFGSTSVGKSRHSLTKAVIWFSDVDRWKADK